jgi:hypothetical protein
MVDPITGAVVAKAANVLRTDDDQVTPGLLRSVLGPPAEALGDALRRAVTYRTRNFGRIVEKANSRLQGKENDGIVNLRVAFALLEEGSLCDDELMAEYLGGLLAGSKSPDGRDDRAVTWTRIVTGLSSFQIRAHYLLYRELAARLRDEAPDLDLSYTDKMNKATMYLKRSEFEAILMRDSSEDPEAILRHSMFGLSRAGLINDSWYYGSGDSVASGFLRVIPTGRGIELYGWVLGVTDLLPRNFVSRAVTLEIPDEIPRLETVMFLDLYPEDEDEDEDEGNVEPESESNMTDTLPGF